MISFNWVRIISPISIASTSFRIPWWSCSSISSTINSILDEFTRVFSHALFNPLIILLRLNNSFAPLFFKTVIGVVSTAFSSSPYASTRISRTRFQHSTICILARWALHEALFNHLTNFKHLFGFWEGEDKIKQLFYLKKVY